MKYELTIISQGGASQDFWIEADIVLTSETELNFYSKDQESAISIRAQTVNGEQMYLCSQVRIGHGSSYIVCKRQP